MEKYYSHQAGSYAAFRPTYPDEFLSRIATLPRRHTLAWDCATGNGQCARGLKKYFDRVVATDISAEQLAQAEQLEGVTFRQAAAEKAPFDNATVDLITVACAVHWFNRSAFYAEVSRVMHPGGIVALWTYFMPRVNAVIDIPIRKYYLDLLAPYYSQEAELYKKEYRDLDFPFLEIPFESASTKQNWSGEQLLGCMSTWSARMTCLKQGEPDPILIILPEFTAAWGDLSQIRPVEFPLYTRVGMVDE